MFRSVMHHHRRWARVALLPRSTQTLALTSTPTQTRSVRAYTSTSHAHSSSTVGRFLLLATAAAAAGASWVAGLGWNAIECESSQPSPDSCAPTSSSSRLDPAVWDPPVPSLEWDYNFDGLESVPPHHDPETGRPIHVTRHLIFIRHGQYVVPSKDDPEDIDPVLTTLGREQARLCGARLKELDFPIARIHASTMARARETAQLIGEHFPDTQIEYHDELREGVPCQHYPTHPTWKPSDEEKATEPVRIQRGFTKIVKRWRQDASGRQIHSEEEWKASQNQVTPPHADSVSPTVATAHGERHSSLDANQPAATGLTSSSSGTIALTPSVASHSTAHSKRPIEIDRYELVVCHGNVIRYSLLRALQLPPQAWLRIAIWNTGITHLYVRSRGIVGIRSMGEVGHLKKDQITYF